MPEGGGEKSNATYSRFKLYKPSKIAGGTVFKALKCNVLQPAEIRHG